MKLAAFFAALIYPGLSNAAPACASAAIMRPFQSARTLSSRNGRTLRLRAARSFFSSSPMGATSVGERCRMFSPVLEPSGLSKFPASLT